MAYKVTAPWVDNTIINYPIEADDYVIDPDGSLNLYKKTDDGKTIRLATFSRGNWSSVKRT